MRPPFISRMVLLPGLVGCALASGCAVIPEAGSGGLSTAAAEPPALSANCVEVSSDLLAQITTGTQPDTPFEPIEGAAVHARDGVYVVAVRFTGREAEPEVGVWTTTAIEGRAAPILVADTVSGSYSSWGSVEEFPTFGVPLGSPHIAEARACLA